MDTLLSQGVHIVEGVLYKQYYWWTIATGPVVVVGIVVCG